MDMKLFQLYARKQLYKCFALLENREVKKQFTGHTVVIRLSCLSLGT